MVNLNDTIWKELTSAGNAANQVLRCLVEETGDFRENIEILAEELSHQLSYYNATAYVLPHLAMLCSKLSLEDKFFLIAHMGAAIAAEGEYPLLPDTQAYQEFQEGLMGLRRETECLITSTDISVLLQAGMGLGQEFALAALAIIGDRKHAYDIWFLSGSCWEEGCVACDCGWNDEMFPLTEQTDCIEFADIDTWDKKSLQNEAVWFKGLLTLAGDEEMSQILPLVYGIGICPDCGKREPYWDWLDRFIKEY